MNLAMIEDKCRAYAKEYWGMELNVPIELNGRLTIALGIMRFSAQTLKPVRIQFSPRLAKHDEDTINKVIKHELCHWALSMKGLPFEDHHPVFEAEIKRIDSISTRVIKSKDEAFKAYCATCGKVVVTAHKESSLTKFIQNKNCRTKCCKALAVRNFGDVIQTSEDLLKDKVVYTIAGKPENGKIILAGRKILVQQENDQVVIGHLLHPSSLLPQKSLVTIEKKYLKPRR